MTKEIVVTERAPEAIGPYSQAVKTGSLVFVSGQIPLDPVTKETIAEDIENQTRQVLKNLDAVLSAAGTSLEKVVKTTLFIKDMRDFPVINNIYSEFFHLNPPARSTVEVARLPKDVKIEIEAIALI
ncbi:MAG: reactive intermediate/imine deaminase [Firmicutes bacterium HGW-Firmicutes-14]|nr:MAG: reactive intermediate/imine deaminase [Firmicutes bacterium HGW-Firmicutes-14]